MIRKICISICWLLIAVCMLSIFIVITRGGIYLFSIGNLHIAVHDIRRPSGFLALFIVILLLLKRIHISHFFIKLEMIASGKLVVYLLAIFMLLLTWIKISQYVVFNTHCDLPCFDYAIFNTVKGNFMYTPILGRNFFSEHFSPILLLFVPIYTIFASSIVLFIVLALTTVLSGYFLYRLAALEIKSNLIPILLLIGYLGNKSLMGGFLFDFHPESLQPLLIIGAFYFFKLKKYILYWINIMLALMCKEDVSIYMFVFGLYILIFGRDIKLGFYTCILSLIWALLGFYIIIPLSHPGGRNVSHFLSRWGGFGSTYGEVVFNLMRNPGFLFSRLFSKPPLSLFSSLLFLPLLAPTKLMLTLPPLLLNLTCNYEPQATLSCHYSASVVPFLWIASIYGLKKIYHKKLSIIIALLIFALNYGHYKFYNINSHVFNGYKILRLIPDEIPISVQYWFIPHVSYRKDIWIFPRIENSEYILVDATRPYWPSSKKDLARQLSRILNTGQWKIVAEEDGYKLLKRQSPN